MLKRITNDTSLVDRNMQACATPPKEVTNSNNENALRQPSPHPSSVSQALFSHPPGSPPQGGSATRSAGNPAAAMPMPDGTVLQVPQPGGSSILSWTTPRAKAVQGPWPESVLKVHQTPASEQGPQQTFLASAAPDAHWRAGQTL
jgi:hypothetical protein